MVSDSTPPESAAVKQEFFESLTPEQRTKLFEACLADWRALVRPYDAAGLIARHSDVWWQMIHVGALIELVEEGRLDALWAAVETINNRMPAVRKMLEALGTPPSSLPPGAAE